MWKPEHRAAADRRGLRYPSDLTDAEWALVAPLIPPAKRGDFRNLLTETVGKQAGKSLCNWIPVEGLDLLSREPEAG